MMEEIGVPTLAITDEPLSPELLGFLDEKTLDIPVYYDFLHEASHAFNQWGTPAYFILDETGRIRFRPTSLDAVKRQVGVLARNEGSR